VEEGIASPPGCNKFGRAVVFNQGPVEKAWHDRSRPTEDETDAETKQAFERLAKESIPRLYGLARRLAGDGAEDLVQECLMRSYRSFDSLEDPQAGLAWMRRILVNAYRDGLRKDSRTVREVPVEEVDEFSLYRTLAEEDPLPYSDSLHVDFLHSFGREDVHAVLMRLPEIYRAPLVLRYMQGFSTKEIAKLLGAPLGTVLARLHRGRKLFEKELWEYANEADLLHVGAAR
jgi:RNA polymerase sigma-70 factor (ECF subfamily)